MALPLLILAGSAIASAGALAYDWAKSATKNPDVVIETTNTNIKDTDKAKIALPWLLLAGGILWLWWKR